MPYSGKIVIAVGITGIFAGVVGSQLLSFDQETEQQPTKPQDIIVSEAYKPMTPLPESLPPMEDLPYPIEPKSLFPAIPEELLPLLKNATVSFAGGVTLDESTNPSEIVTHVQISGLDCNILKQAWDTHKDSIALGQTGVQAAQLSAHADELFNDGQTVRAILFNKSAFSTQLEQFELFTGRQLQDIPEEDLEELIEPMPDIIDVSVTFSCAPNTFGNEL